MPYVLNFFACFYGYLFAAFLVTLSAAQLAEWFVHRHLSTWIPYVSDLGLAPRAIVVNYLVQGALGLLLGSILSFHFAPPRDNPNMVLKAVAVSMLSPNLFAVCSVPRDVLDMTV